MKQFLHFWELKGSYLLVKNSFWKGVIKNKKRFSNINNIKNYLNQYKNPARAQYIPIKKFIQIANIVHLNIRKIEKDNLIIGLKSGETGKPLYNIKFPINLLSKEFACIIGGALSEGCITRDIFKFWNTDYNLMIKFNKLMNKALNTHSIIKEKKGFWKGYYLVYPTIVSKIFNKGMGFKSGKKVINDPKIPNIYTHLDFNLEKNKIMVGRLLSWLYSGDGGIYLFKDCNKRTQRCIDIGFSNNSNKRPSRLLDDAYYLIKQIGIRPHPIALKINKKRKAHHGYHWRFFIRGKENFEIFKKYINFEQPEKRRVLDMAIKSYVKPNLKKGEAVYKVTSVIKEKQPCSVHEIAKSFISTKDRVLNILEEAREKGLIKVISGGNRRVGVIGGRYPYIYETTSLGRKYLKDIGGKYL